MQTILEIATPISVLVAACGLFLGARAHRRQMNVQTFLAFTERYERIMESYPGDAAQARLDLQGDLPPETEELRLSALRYLNLCAEEYCLHRRGYIARDVWDIWEAELVRTVASPLYRRAWNSLRPEFESFPEFVAFVERVQRAVKNT